VERAGGYVIDVRFGDVVGLDLFEDFGVDAHLAVSAVLLAAGMDAEPAIFTEGKAQAKGRKDSHGEDEDETLEESRHGHHRESLQGNGALTYIDVMIAKTG
jgi:hypothetical protein